MKAIRSIVPYAILTVLVFLSLFFVLELWNSNLLKYPLCYEFGDSIHALFRFFAMQESGSLFHLPNINGTMGTDVYSFYALDILLLLFQWLIVLICQNYVLAFNVFILSSFFLVAYAAFYVLKKLNISTAVAILMSVVYSLLPYHLMRFTTHSYLGFYFLVPFACLFAIQIYQGEFAGSFASYKTNKKVFIANTVILILIGTTGFYYALFSCFCFLIATVCCCISTNSFRYAKDGMCAILKVVFGVLISGIPLLLGSGGSVSRSVVCGEKYSARLLQLLLPINNHRISAVAELKSSYNSFIDSNFENDSCSLGFLLAIGLICILLYGFIALNKNRKDSMFRPLFVFSLSFLFLFMPGTLATVLCFVFPYVRCYCRAVVFVAFFACIAIALILDKIKLPKIGKSSKPSRALEIAIVSIICAVAIVDQTSTAYIPDYSRIQNDFDTYSVFVSDIVSEYEDDTDVNAYFMPYLSYPEAGSIGGLFDYEPFMLLIHNDRLSVSYGAFRGSDSANTLEQTFLLPISQQIEFAKTNDYNGLILATSAYDASYIDVVVAEISSCIGEPDAQAGEYMFWAIN